MITIKLVDARRGLYEKCKELFSDRRIADQIYMFLCDGIEECDFAEPERKCGKWLPDNTNYITPHFVCSACGMPQKVETAMYKPIWAFCPRCGARMMEGEQDG